MNTSDYVRSLLPNIDRETVLENLTVVNDHVTKRYLPSYTDAADTFKDKFTNKDVLKLEAAIKTATGGTSLISAVIRVLNNIKLLGDDLQAFIRKNWGDQIATAGISYNTQNVLQLSDLLRFTGDYADRLLMWIYNKELSDLGASPDITNNFTPAQNRFLENNRINFIKCVEFLTKSARMVKSSLDSIPEIAVIPEKDQAMQRTYGSGKLDPLRLGFVNFDINPLYRVSLMIGQWQAEHYEKVKEDKKALELRRLYLESLRNGEQNANLERQITNLDTRIEKASMKLANMEDKWEI